MDYNVEDTYDQILQDFYADLLAKRITVEQYYKKIITLSYELALKDRASEALIIFINVDPAYYDHWCIKHFEEDNEFFKKCVFLFELFEYNTWAELVVEATQKPASA